MFTMTVNSRGEVIWHENREKEVFGRREIANATFERYLLKREILGGEAVVIYRG